MSRNIFNRYSSQGVKSCVFADTIVSQICADGSVVHQSIRDVKAKDISYASSTIEAQQRNNNSLGVVTPTSTRLGNESKIASQLESITSNNSENE